MKDNKLKIRINKSVPEVFAFTTTPPNSKYWINSIIDEETNEWPIHVGTVYKLMSENGQQSEVVVASIKKNEIVEWVSRDNVYHCKYNFKAINENTTELKYYEWVDKGIIDNPFTQDTLERLKLVLENFKKSSSS